MSDLNQATIDRYTKRLAAITALAENWDSIFDVREIPKEEPPIPLVALLKDFKKFSKDYFNYFKAAYNTTPSDNSDQTPNGDFQRSLEVENTFSQILRRIQTEFDNISLACIQRESGKFKKPLADADERAKTYYERFLGSKPHDALPITYFGKYHAITRYPFTPYAIVSLPAEVCDNDGDWWAIAHELGHHIYWNASSMDTYRSRHEKLGNIVVKTLYDFCYASQNDGLDDRTRARIFSKLVDIWLGWLEETFADICGTLMAGVGYANSAAARAKAARDGLRIYPAHPIPYIRPLISIFTLEWVKKNKPKTPETLEDPITQLNEVMEKIKLDSEVFEIFGVAGFDIFIMALSFEPIVTALLDSQVWEKATSPDDDHAQGGEERPRLGDLFNIDDWRSKLPEIEYQKFTSQQEASSAAAREDDQPGEAFTNLVTYLREMLGDNEQTGDLDKRLNKTLLELDLGEDKHVDAIAYTPAPGVAVSLIVSTNGTIR